METHTQLHSPPQPAGNTTSPLHYDDYENLLCQIKGVKELTLFPPADIHYLYYTGRAKGVLEYEYPAQFTRRTLATAQGVNVVFGWVGACVRAWAGGRGQARVRLTTKHLTTHPHTTTQNTNHQRNSSSVHLGNPDLSKHPELPKATPYKVRLRPGSVLYLPSYWHHEVHSVPDEQEGLNLAINYWFRNETAFAEEAQGLRAAARHKKQRQQQAQRPQV